MQRRTLLAALAVAPFISRALAEAPDYQMRLISDAKATTFGLHIKLAKGWKTYWRVPGEAGIPPQVKIESPNIESAEILYPLPQRLLDDSGEAIGYHDEVVFILKPKRTAAATNGGKLQGNLHAFLGVCQIICKPVKYDAELASAITDDATLNKFLERLPSPANFVNEAEQADKSLELTLTQKVDDIFIDGPDSLYFRKPEFTTNIARFKIDGLQEGQSLKGVSLRITAVTKGKGLEQTIAIT